MGISFEYSNGCIIDDVVVVIIVIDIAIAIAGYVFFLVVDSTRLAH